MSSQQEEQVKPVEAEGVSNVSAQGDGNGAEMETQERHGDEASKPPAGRFVENISTDGSRDSDENQPEPAAEEAEPEMRQVGSAPVRRASNKRTSEEQVPRTHSNKAEEEAQHPTPSTEASTRHQASGDQQSSSEEEEDQEEEKYHPILTAMYPLTHFIGFRPLSHPHTPPERRLSPSDAGFNRFHYLCGRVLSLGLPATGEHGAIAQYRDPDTGKLTVVRMYREQARGHITDSIHSTIAAWGIIVFLSLISRSPFYRAHSSPLIIGSFATEAVVTYYAFRTPLAQPKNILLGNAISSIIGVALQIAFSRTSYSVSGVYGINWAAASTSVAAALLVMELLGIVHPPGAAFALLSVTSRPTERLGWYVVPIAIIGSLVVIGWAMIANNLGGRRWPQNWAYKGGVQQPPIIGPENLPFANSSIEWPKRNRGAEKRKRGGEQQKNTDEEKGFYRVPNSGTRVENGYSKTNGNDGAQREGVEDGRTTRTSQLTKVESDPNAQPAPTAGASRMIEDPALASSMARNNSRGSKHSVVVHVNENVRRMSGGAANASGNGRSRAKENIPAVPAVQWRSPE